MILNTTKPLIVLATGLFLFVFNTAYSQALTANAGSPQTICKGDSATLGGTPTATGGTPPYTYSWTATPSAGMNNAADANPHAIINQTTKFYVTVIDNIGARQIDSVVISLSNISAANAGHDTSICPLTAGATLGGKADSSSYVYSWTPLGSGLSCYNCAHPTATPSSTTQYTLTVSNGSCGDTTKVTVTVLATPTITVVTPVVVNQGSSVT
ncbi:MAG TPA: hypothetical protein VN922_15595, partial [Bacteroidia bacterium]|nr:hypothetical protein [Bacteroidia bacterium]